MASEITIDTAWGREGSELNGEQVETFIKDQFRSLISRDTTISNQIGSLQRLHNIDITGILNKIGSIEERLRMAADGCFISYISKDSGKEMAVPYWNWGELQNSGEVANGVLMLLEGRSPILIAPNHKQVFWAESNYIDNGGEANIGDSYTKAYSDFNGAEHTSRIHSDNRITSDFAIGYCIEYSRAYSKETDGSATSIGIWSGRWWLPSVGELIAIWKRKEAINLCLSAINGADKLPSSLHLSSSYNGTNLLWGVDMGKGIISATYSKTGDMGYARPITSYTHDLIGS